MDFRCICLSIFVLGTLHNACIYCSLSCNIRCTMLTSDCGILCLLSSGCRSFFYTMDTKQCRRGTPYNLGEPYPTLHTSPSSVYYELDDGFQTVFLDDGDVLTYKIFYGKVKVPYQTAVQGCLSYGGHLIHIFIPARYAFFQTLNEDLSDRGPWWIDVTNKYAADYDDINGWTTEAGQAMPLTFWANGEPFNTDIEHCAVLVASLTNNLWRTRDCDDEGRYICEL